MNSTKKEFQKEINKLESNPTSSNMASFANNVKDIVARMPDDSIELKAESGEPSISKRELFAKDIFCTKLAWYMTCNQPYSMSDLMVQCCNDADLLIKLIKQSKA